MATFKIDGTTVTPYPRTIQWARPIVATAHTGKPIYSSYWEATITFPTMTTTLWNSIATLFTDAAAHTIQVPHPNTATDTTFSNVYFELLSRDLDLGLYVYNVQVKVKRILVT